jgi:hypothetical protein
LDRRNLQFPDHLQDWPGRREVLQANQPSVA